MPMYEFVCDQCGKKFEELCRSSDTEVKCPQCGSTRVTRQFSAFACKGGGAGGGCSSCSGGSCSTCH